MTNDDETPLGEDGEPIFTAEQIEEAKARDHGGYGPVRRTLLLMLTKSVNEMAQAAIENPELREEMLQVAECSAKYFEWLDEDRGMLKCGNARLLGALLVCRDKVCPEDTP